MFDPDPQPPILRLAEDAEARANAAFKRWMQSPAFAAAVRAPNPHRPAADATEALVRVTLAQHEMDRASLRWVEAVMEYDALRAQAQPISAVRDGNVRF